MNGTEEFILRLKEHGLDIHSIHIEQDGEVLCDAYAPPYRNGGVHRMYSISKSMTSLAIGLLADEGRLSLTDEICGYFPEYVGTDTHEYIRRTTIEDMLTMRTPFKGAVHDKFTRSDWTRPFFNAKPDKLPGTFFAYDTTASHVLAALVERLSGGDMLDYLRRRGVPFSDSAYMLKDALGVSMGGSGLICSAEDIAAISRLLLNNDGSVFPKAYVSEATRIHANPELRGKFLAERIGYGYMFWILRGGYMMYGLGGQLALIFPDKRLFGIITADVNRRSDGVSFIIDEFIRCVYSGNALFVQTELNLPCISGSPFPRELCGDWGGLIIEEDFLTINGVTLHSDMRDFRGNTAQCSGGMVEPNRARFIVKLTRELIGQIDIELIFKDGVVCVYMTSNTDIEDFNGYRIFGRKL